jgi:FdhD protein
MPTTQRTIETTVERVDGDGARELRDTVAVEEPLEIRLRMVDQAAERSVSITMRTPGDDAELAVGYLVTEGIVRDRAQVVDVRHLGPAGRPDANVIVATLRDVDTADLVRLVRLGLTSSACGACGKASLDALRATPPWPPADDEASVDVELVHRLPRLLRDAQDVFDATGGLHAAALFDAGGALVCLREDVGRHNAVDKVVGAQLLAGALPARDRILLVSGRASFELAQKAVMAGVPVLAAVGAPSSLAVDVAAESGLTLLGFVRDGRFNVYAGAHRVHGARLTSHHATAQ